MEVVGVTVLVPEVGTSQADTEYADVERAGPKVGHGEQWQRDERDLIAG